MCRDGGIYEAAVTTRCFEGDAARSGTSKACAATT